MADEQNAAPAGAEYTQLTQARVPLDEAADVFAARDPHGRVPLVVLPKRLNRIHNEMVAAALIVLVAGIAGGWLLNTGAIWPLASLLALVLLVLGVYRSFIVRIPEGVSGLLAKGGRYSRTIGPGSHIIPPWVLVSHLVTQREVPFDVPAVEVPTQDNVRVNVDILITFGITDPYRFVYSISADDFDQVFQAVCQDALRTLMRVTPLDKVANMTRDDLAALRETLGADIEPYGVTLKKIAITYAQPPAAFMESLEARRLAALQLAEQAEKQALLQQRQADEEALARQKIVAEVDRDRAALEAQFQQAEARRRVVELEAEAEELRLAELEERLKKYPAAADWEWQGEQLSVARALAGNTRSVLQIGSAGDIARAFVVRDMISPGATRPGDNIPGDSHQ